MESQVLVVIIMLIAAAVFVLNSFPSPLNLNTMCSGLKVVVLSTIKLSICTHSVSYNTVGIKKYGDQNEGGQSPLILAAKAAGAKKCGDKFVDGGWLHVDQ